jgi:hypothetical protein
MMPALGPPDSERAKACPLTVDESEKEKIDRPSSRSVPMVVVHQVASQAGYITMHKTLPATPGV